MSEVKTYQQADEPTDTTPGTGWLRADGTKAQRDLSGAWVEKGSWTLENDGMLPKAGGAVTGAVTGNHGHAPMDSPAFTTNATLDGEDLSTKPWVQEQLTNLQTELQNYIIEALGGGESSLAIGQNIAFGYGTLAHGATVPLPTYSSGVKAVKSEIVLLLASMYSAQDSTSDRAIAIAAECWIDPDTLLVTARHRIVSGGGGSNWASDGSANYIIVCVKS